jgi:hypothetical protein
MVCRKQDSGFNDLGQGHCRGSNFLNFDVNIHKGRDGRVCSELICMKGLYLLLGFKLFQYLCYIHINGGCCVRSVTSIYMKVSFFI